MSPILYSPAQLPEDLAVVMNWNPMTWFVFQLRELLLFGRIHLGLPELMAVVVTLALCWLSLRFFRRFSGHFEDFL